MTIERRLKLTTGVLILFAVVTGVILYLGFLQVEQGLETMGATSELVQSAFMLHVLMNEYLDHGSKRPLRQWRLQKESLGKILNDPGLNGSVDSVLLEELKNRYAIVTSAFRQVMSQLQAKTNEEPPVVREELHGLMIIRLEQLVNSAIELNAATQTLTLKKRKLVQWLIMATSAIMVVIIVVNLALIRKSVVAPLKILSSGAESVGEGRFESIAEIPRDDEVGSLTRAFNVMIEALKGRTAALKQAHEELERKVLDRTADLLTINSRLEVEITRRRQVEEAVRAERQQLYNLLETLPVYVMLMAQDFRVPFANHFFRERFGESPGKRCFEYLHGLTEPCDICRSLGVLETMAPRHWEWQSQDGRHYEVQAFPFTDTDGSSLVMEVGIDITDRKHAEEARKHILDELIRSNADLEQFAYVASHDLQEPLRNVAGSMQLLDKRYKGKLDAEADKLIWYAVDSAARMKALITDLLAYSRVSTRGKALKPVNCEEVLEQTLRSLRPSIAESGIVITHDPLPTVIADFTQLMQVVQNLLVNAIKFRGTETPHIHVSASRDGDNWVFCVKDNGIGIESRYLDRIFLIFQRLHKKSEYEGTGMGLAIVKKILERHHGRIWVESEPGKGTTFYFTIPASATTRSEVGKP